MKKTKINFLTITYWIVWMGVLGSLVLIQAAPILNITALQSLMPILIPVMLGGACMFAYIFLNSFVSIGKFVEKWIEE